jgi:hypothetical protein
VRRLTNTEDKGSGARLRFFADAIEKTDDDEGGSGEGKGREYGRLAWDRRDASVESEWSHFALTNKKRTRTKADGHKIAPPVPDERPAWPANLRGLAGDAG